MKIRTGFVSNSSSSSFVAIVTKEAFDKAVEMVKDERYRKILRGIGKQRKAFGTTVVVIQDMSDSGGYSSTFGEGTDFDYESMGLTESEMFPEIPEEGEEDEFCPSSALYEYQEALETLQKEKEFKDSVLITDDMGNG